MTSNQIAYQTLKENERSNKAREDETARSNRAKEDETKRSNLATEAETSRHNQTVEKETERYNKNKNATDYINAGANVVKSATGVAKLFL